MLNPAYSKQYRLSLYGVGLLLFYLHFYMMEPNDF